MKKEIVDFVIAACVKYGLESYYIPDNDCYVLTKKGRAVQNFNTIHFYQIPRKRRMWEYRALIKAGLAHNLGESYKNSLFLPRRFGIKIYPK